jgi:predicted nucleic acid-binding protein
MTRYLLDTDTLIDFSKGRESTRSRILQMIEAGDVLGVCAINVSEFYAGLPEAQRSIWDAFFASLPYWHISREAAIQAGRERYEFSRQGQTVTTADALIAAVARENQATIITSNIKDYPMPGVSLLSPREAR